MVPGLVSGEGAPPPLTGGPVESSDGTFVSNVDGIRMGQSVAIAGDVNGDGYADVVVGAPGDDEISHFEGLVSLKLGGPRGWANRLTPGFYDAHIYGETAGDWAGYSVSGAGDFNGDGLDDILVGAPKRNGEEGAAYLILGRDAWTDFDLGSADALFTGTGSENAGWNVSAAGDVDGDGLDDLLVGAPGFNSYQGRAYLLFGEGVPRDRLLANADVVMTGEASGDQAGFSVAGAGDVDGDALDDLLIGAPYYSQSDEGRAYLITDLHGGPFPLSISLGTDADRKYTGTAGQSVGFSVDILSDKNGDGFSDLLISFVTTTGGAYLVLGGSNPKASCTLDICTDQGYRGISNSSTGGRVATVGDVNADGYGDLLIGACDYDDSDKRGRASLVLGEGNPTGVIDLGTDIDVHYTGMTALDSACIAQNGTGDVNGDGISDIVIGAPDFSNKQGRAYVIFADDKSSMAARYRAWDGHFYGRDVGHSDVTAIELIQGRPGTVNVTRHFRGTCNEARYTNGLHWTVDVYQGASAEYQFVFKYNNTQIAGWNEPDLNLWYRDRPCQDWTHDAGAVLDEATNRFTSQPVVDPHREYTISPGAPGPTQLGLTGSGAFRVPKSPWPALAAVALLLFTVWVEWRRRRMSKGRSEADGSPSLDGA
jgi:hypothetical protein